MTRVLAAIDGTAVSPPVLTVAREVSRVTGADLDAIHVTGGGATVDAEGCAARAGVRLRLCEPPVGDTLVAEASGSDVEVVVLGLRQTIGGSTPAGHVALEVIGRTHSPVVAVPPVPSPGFELRTILAPVQGVTDVPERVIRIAHGARLELTLLHVHDERSIPSFEDRPHYDTETWADEFVARWVPGARQQAVMELRVGAPEEEIMRYARDSGADMIALGWSQDLSPGRASVVRLALERSPVPVALMPIRVPERATD
jgi:nucleotide-binding universal stress UspA family protein